MNAAYRTFEADRIVIETNAGGDMAEQTLRTVDPNIPITRIHAKRGKGRTDCQPI
jgi:phage terminase large subunit-like protein